jgi:hypothetical protein
MYVTIVVLVALRYSRICMYVCMYVWIYVCIYIIWSKILFFLSFFLIILTASIHTSIGDSKIENHPRVWVCRNCCHRSDLIRMYRYWRVLDPLNPKDPKQIQSRQQDYPLRLDGIYCIDYCCFAPTNNSSRYCY